MANPIVKPSEFDTFASDYRNKITAKLFSTDLATATNDQIALHGLLFNQLQSLNGRDPANTASLQNPSFLKALNALTPAQMVTFLGSDENQILLAEVCVSTTDLRALTCLPTALVSLAASPVAMGILCKAGAITSLWTWSRDAAIVFASSLIAMTEIARHQPTRDNIFVQQHAVGLAWDTLAGSANATLQGLEHWQTVVSNPVAMGIIWGHAGCSDAWSRISNYVTYLTNNGGANTLLPAFCETTIGLTALLESHNVTSFATALSSLGVVLNSTNAVTRIANSDNALAYLTQVAAFASHVGALPSAFNILISNAKARVAMWSSQIFVSNFSPTVFFVDTLIGLGNAKVVSVTGAPSSYTSTAMVVGKSFLLKMSSVTADTFRLKGLNGGQDLSSASIYRDGSTAFITSTTFTVAPTNGRAFKDIKHVAPVSGFNYTFTAYLVDMN